MILLNHILSILSILFGLFNGVLFVQGIRDHYGFRTVTMNGFAFIFCTSLGLCLLFGWV
jgi:hypothetical protein